MSKLEIRSIEEDIANARIVGELERAEEKGIKIGKKIGREQGLKIGREQGILEAKKIGMVYTIPL